LESERREEEKGKKNRNNQGKSRHEQKPQKKIKVMHR
jgi:hypothetical protein